MELVVPDRLDRWFAERLQGLRCRDDTRAYVTGLLAGFHAGGDMSRDSVVLAFRDAQVKGDFAAFQRIGDWVLWVDAVNPTSINDYRQVAESFGRQAYYACHRIMRGQWHLYEELADDLPRIAYAVRCKLRAERVTFGP